MISELASPIAVAVTIVAASFGIGRHLLSLALGFRLSAALSLGTGSAALAFIGFTVLAAGGSAPLGRALIVAVALAGAVAAVVEVRKLSQNSLPDFTRTSVETLLWLFPVLFVAAQVITACLPDMHPDALWYNLPAARYWASSGTVGFSADNIAISQAAAWDYLYTLPALVFYSGDPRSLWQLQISAQLVHALLGFSVSIALVVELLSFGSYRTAWLAVAAFAAATSPDLLYTTTTAKNDFGTLAWFLTGVCLALESSSRAQVFGGLFLGLAVAAKMSYAFIVLPFAAIFLASSPVAAVRISGAAFLAFMPLALRNYLSSGNPFFPVFDGVFQSPILSATWSEAMARYNPGVISWEATLHKMHSWFSPSNAIALFFLLPSSFIRRRAGGESPVVLTINRTVLFSIVFFVIGSGPWAETRLVGFIQVWIRAVAICKIGELLHERSKVLQLVAASVVLIYLAVPAIRETSEQRVGFLGGKKAADLSPDRNVFGALNQEKGRALRIALAQEPRVYPFLPFRGERLWDNALLDNELRKLQTPAETARFLCSKGFTHLVVSKYSFDAYFYVPTVALLNQIPIDVPFAILAESELEQLVDLHRTGYCET